MRVMRDCGRSGAHKIRATKEKGTKEGKRIDRHSLERESGDRRCVEISCIVGVLSPALLFERAGNKRRRGPLYMEQIG